MQSDDITLKDVLNQKISEKKFNRKINKNDLRLIYAAQNKLLNQLYDDIDAAKGKNEIMEDNSTNKPEQD